MELGVNIIGVEIISEMVLILCFDVLIFMVKDRLCSINYSKKYCMLHYLGFIWNYNALCVAWAFR